MIVLTSNKLYPGKTIPLDKDGTCSLYGLRSACAKFSWEKTSSYRVSPLDAYLVRLSPKSVLPQLLCSTIYM